MEEKKILTLKAIKCDVTDSQSTLFFQSSHLSILSPSQKGDSHNTKFSRAYEEII